MAPKADWEKYKKADEDQKDDDKIVALDEGDIQLLKTYGQGPYARQLKDIENEIKEVQKRVNERMGVKESDTGLAPPNLWDLAADRQRMSQEQPLQVARCTKIIRAEDEKKRKEEAAQAQPNGGRGATQQNGNAGSSGEGSGGSGGSGSDSPPSGGSSGGGAAGGLAGSLGALGGLNPLGGAPPNAEEEDKYVINVKQIAKFVVALGDRVAPTDIEEGMRVGCVPRSDGMYLGAR